MEAGVFSIVLALFLGVLSVKGFPITVEIDDNQERFESDLQLPQEEGKLLDTPFDYFILSQQWAGTYCKSSGTCCEKVELPANFTIHGLWPENNDSSYPECCSGPGFDQNKVAELEDLLQQYWPTMSCSSPTQCNGKKIGSFWQHEWEKHGTCSYPIIPDEATYFTVGLNLRLKYDIMAIFAKAGIVPSSSKKYDTRTMVNVIKKAIGGYSPVFTCKSKQINEIWICFTKDLKIRNCGASSNSCPNSISIPPFPY